MSYSRHRTGNLRRIAKKIGFLLAAGRALAATGEVNPDVANSPEAELASFKVAPGFEVNLFASEKDGVVKPIQIRWDTRGRLWVIGSTTYPQIKPGEVANDKVLILEDTDGDGRADRTTVFADGLEIPTGLEVGKGERLRAKGEAGEASGTSEHSPLALRPSPFSSSCYVGEGSKLLLLTDTDGDGKCDKREVVLRGFGTGDDHQNINSFRWSPGGELMFSQGLHGHARVETPHGIVALDEAGFFRFRPREMRLDAFYGGQAEPQNPWGFVWTDWGQMLMVAGNNGGIYYPLPEMIRGVQGGRREQIWVNARGRKCSGPDIIGTAHLPPEWQGVMLSGGYINNAVWALKIEDDGAGFKVTDFGGGGERRTSNAERRTSKKEAAAVPSDPSAFDVRRSVFDVSPPHISPPLSPPGAFLTSTDTSFRPVDVKIGPDGAIYICDWFNPIIGHYQASFRHPDRDKTHGRIWRVTYKGRPLVKPPAIAGAPLTDLFENLKSPERWVREQSKRELAGRETAEVVNGLRQWWPKVAASGRAASGSQASSLTGKTGFQPVEPPAPDGQDARLPGQAGSLSSGAERALVEALGVFEAHETPEPALLEKLFLDGGKDGLTFAAGALARWYRHLGPVDAEGLVSRERVLAALMLNPEIRVRLAGIVAAGNINDDDSLAYLLVSPFEDRDKFVALATRSAITALKPHLEAVVAKGNEHGKGRFRDRFAELDRPLTSTKPAAPAATAAVKPLAAIPATGKLRATPEAVAALVREVKESGNAKHGAEVFRRPELACTSCHSLEDKGGKIGPPLDAIGSGQPLDFIIGAVLEPQREIKESYEAMQLTLKDGRVSLGYIVQRDAASTTLRDPATGAEQRFAATDLAETKPIGSFMPAGLIDNLPRPDLRDLFRYLSELGKPKP